MSINAPAEAVEDSTFEARLTGLNAKTTYLFRANAVGDGSAVYGDDMTFTTAAAARYGGMPTWAWVLILIGACGCCRSGYRSLHQRAVWRRADGKSKTVGRDVRPSWGGLTVFPYCCLDGFLENAK